jgi:hypothetical protein
MFEESLSDVTDLRLSVTPGLLIVDSDAAAFCLSPIAVRPRRRSEQYIDGKNFSIDIHLIDKLIFVTVREKSLKYQHRTLIGNARRQGAT